MKYIICFGLLFSFVFAVGQGINWQKAKDWKMYNIIDDVGLGYSIDTLGSFPFVKMNTDSVRIFLKNVELLPKEKYYVWMGAYYVTCSIDSIIHKVDISVHGGFFYDESTKRYYQLPMSQRNDWMAWLNDLRKRTNK